MAFDWGNLFGMTGIGKGYNALFGGNNSGGDNGSGGFFGGGTPGGVQQVSRLTPDQQQYLPQLLQMAFQQYQNPTQGFGDIENDAWRQFNSSILPGIQQKYNTGNDHYSSGPGQRAAYGAGADLQSRLASARAQFGQQNKQDSLKTLLNPNYVSNVTRPGQPGLEETLLPHLLKALTAYYGGGF